MKKTIMAMLLATTLMFTACSDLAKTGILSFEENGTEETVTVEGTTEETTDASVTTSPDDVVFPEFTFPEETVPTDSSENVPESVASSEKTVPANVSIKVTDAFNKTFKSGKYKYSFKIPKVTISGVDTSDANKTIKDETYKYYQGSYKKHYAVSYKSYINKMTVSILVCVTELIESDPTEVFVYNIDIKTGRLVNDSELVQLYGTKTKSFFKKVKSIYKKFNKAENKNGGGKSWTSENLKKVNYNYVHPYINSKGHLCFIGFTNWAGGSGYGYTSFDLSTKKYIKIGYYTGISKAK